MPDYILEPLDTDSDVIYQNFVDYINQSFPDWQPSEGQLDVMIARYFAMQAAFTADMATRVQRAIFRYFGSSLANIPPLSGSQATALVHFVIVDVNVPPVDHSMPLGTLVALTDSDGDNIAFSLSADLTAPAGTTEVEVTVQALDLGEDGNNITGTVQMIEQVDWIQTAYVAGFSSGGSDPEEDSVYIERLSNNLALMAPRPILADDFTVFAQNVPGVWRAAVLDNFRPGIREVQTITSNYTTGTWTATFNGKVTAPIPAHATAANVRDAMGLLPNFDVEDGDFTGGPLGTLPITITFKGKYVYTDVPAITATTTGLSGGTSFTIVETTKGTPYALDMENAIAISAVDSSGNPLAPDIKQTLIDYLASTRAQNFIITFVDPAYHTIDVTYTAHALRYQDSDSVETAVNNSLAYYLDPSQWGMYPNQAQSRIWTLQPMVRYLELTTIIENTSGVDYIDSLAFALDGGTMDATNKSFTGPFSLTRPGTFNGTINLPV
jgi:hypothetical protein